MILHMYHSVPQICNLSLSTKRREGAYVQDKNTSAGLCTKNAGEAYARGGGGGYCRTLRLAILQHAELIFGIHTDKNVTKNFKCTNKLTYL